MYIFCYFTDIDDCIGVTACVHGECVDGLEAFTCNCSLGWTGNTCSESK